MQPWPVSARVQQRTNHHPRLPGLRHALRRSRPSSRTSRLIWWRLFDNTIGLGRVAAHDDTQLRCACCPWSRSFRRGPVGRHPNQPRPPLHPYRGTNVQVSAPPGMTSHFLRVLSSTRTCGQTFPGRQPAPDNRTRDDAPTVAPVRVPWRRRHHPHPAKDTPRLCRPSPSNTSYPSRLTRYVTSPRRYPAATIGGWSC